jgi:Arc/MetJ-type ribon-helix-helix transcriptional regulator
MTATRNVALPEELCAAVEQKFGRRFGSVDEFVAAALSHLLRDDALMLDAKEQQIIEERLKGLGYI